MLQHLQCVDFGLHAKQILAELLFLHAFDGHLLAGQQMRAQANLAEATCNGVELRWGVAMGSYDVVVDESWRVES